MNYTMPTVSDITQFLNDEAYHDACRAVSKHRFLDLDEDAGTLAVGTGLSSRLLIRLMPDGTVTTSSNWKDTGLPALTQETERVPIRASSNTYFSGAWIEVLNVAHTVLRQRLNAFMGINGYQHLSAIDPGLPRNAYEIMKVLSLPAVTDAIGRCAQAVRARNGHGYIGNPIGLAYALLHRLLGRNQVSWVLRAAGAHATLQEWNTCVRHRDALLAAHDANPNATILWFAAKRNQHPKEETKENPTPETIIQQARRAFTEENDPLNSSFFAWENLPWETIRLPDTNEEWERAWLAFSKLPQQAVNHFPPVGDSHSFVAIIAAQSGANPSYSAVREIVPRWTSYSILPAAMLRSFCFESARRARKPRTGLTQQDLAAQLRAALTFAEACLLPQNGPRRPVPEWAWIALTEQDSPIPWSEWAKDIPEDQVVASQQRNASTRRRPKQKRQPGQSWSEKRDQLVQLMLGPAKEELAHALENAVTLESVPGRSVTLRAKTQDQPVLRVERNPDRSLLVEANGYWTGNILLPAPDLHAKTDTLTTRGLVSRTKRELATSVIQKMLQDQPGAEVPNPNRVSAALREIAPRSEEEDANLSKQLVHAIHALVDPIAWYDAHNMSHDDRVTISRYNLAAQTRPFLAELQQTNPGAVAWAFAACEPQEPINHPGQVISMVREFLQGSGLEPETWRTAARMAQGTVCLLANACTTPQAALILNALALAGTQPEDSVILHAVRVVKRQDLRAGNPQDPHYRNALTLLTLFFREAATLPDETPGEDDAGPGRRFRRQTPREALAPELRNISDYTSAQAWNGAQVLSTTWNGLRKASERWHRDLRQSSMDTKWLQIVAAQEGQYRAWNSHLGETQVDELALVPLRSEFDLYQEAKEMEHCVINYGGPCASGRSRIFSVRENGARTATGEIQLYNGSWRETQTRGHRNHPVPDHVRDGVARAAELYTQAWSAKQQNPHTSWLVPYQADEEQKTLNTGLPPAA